jgi:hypothetical protein
MMRDFYRDNEEGKGQRAKSRGQRTESREQRAKIRGKEQDG